MEPNAQQPQPQNTNEQPKFESPAPGTSITPRGPSMPEAPTPVLATPVEPPVVPEKKSSRKSLLVLLLVLLLAIAAGAVYWFVLKGDDAKTGVDTSNSSQTQTPTTGEFDPAVKFAQYAADIKLSHPEMEKFESYNDGTENANGSVVLYSKNIEHYVMVPSPNDWSGKISREAKAEDDTMADFTKAPYDELVAKLQTDGFSEYILEPKLKYEEDPTFYMKHDDVVCELLRYTNEILYSCASLRELDVQAEFVKPFYETYIQEFSDANTDGCLVINLTNKSVEEAENASDYEIARGGVGCAGGVGGAAANFYRKKGGEWKFSHGGQDAPLCSEFDNTDQQKAFASESCYPGGGVSDMSTVKEHFKL